MPEQLRKAQEQFDDAIKAFPDLLIGGAAQAFAEMTLHDKQTGFIEGSTGSHQLGQNCFTILPLLNHALQTADLPLDAAQAHQDVCQGLLIPFCHGGRTSLAVYTPWGYGGILHHFCALVKPLLGGGIGRAVVGSLWSQCQYRRRSEACQGRHAQNCIV